LDYDTIIIGLGAMGSSAAYQLASNGNRVLGLDRFHPPHTFGSSHGRTRIIREAYFEDSSYVPLVQRAYELWAALEQKSGRKLLLQTGGLMIGTPGSTLVAGALNSAKEHKLKHEVLSADEIHRRFPGFSPGQNTLAVWEPRAGILFPETIVETHLELAAREGATLKFNEPVCRWETEGEGVRVMTESNTYRAKRLLISTGPWLNSILNSNSNHLKKTPVPGSPFEKCTLPLSVERQVLFWFQPLSHPERFQPQACPIYIWEYEPNRFFYGFPDLGDGMKLAFHHQGTVTDPDNLNTAVTPEEIESMHSLLDRFLPSAAGQLKSHAVCMYTNTPDEHFIIDFHPCFGQVLLVSPCSGHGFKFSSVIGLLAADLLLGRRVDFDLSRFKVDRFENTK
jgi:sarcosine oxidase